jgi:hypothetical protein
MALLLHGKEIDPELLTTDKLFEILPNRITANNVDYYLNITKLSISYKTLGNNPQVFDKLIDVVMDINSALKTMLIMLVNLYGFDMNSKEQILYL